MPDRADRGDHGNSPRRLLCLALIWSVVTAGSAVVAGCFGHNCDGGDPLTYGSAPGEGRLLNADTWESNPIDGDWLPFPRNRVWIFAMRELGDRTPDLVVPYVSAEPNPVRDATNWTIGAGNIVEQSGAAKGVVTIHNGTCADYYLRLVVQASPRPTGSPPLAGDAGDAGDADAGP